MKNLPVFALIVFTTIFACGCEKKGPTEEAGEKIDKAYTDALKKAEEAGDKIEDAGKKIEAAIEEAEESAKGD